MTVWLNGEFIDAGARIDVSDRGFLLGDGVFETIYVEDSTPAFIDAHLTRLNRGLEALGIGLSLEARVVAAIVAELAGRNDLAKGRAAARLTVSRGPGARGLATPPADALRPTRLLSLAAYEPPAAPLRLAISTARRYSRSVSARFKTLSYLDSVLARNEAARAGADEAVMLNEHGRVACTSAANIFLIRADGAVAVPPVEEGALPGVVRGTLIAAASRQGLAVEERPIAVEEVKNSGLVLTNSLMGVADATLVDGGPPIPTPMLERLQSWYARALKDDLAAIRSAL
ncbi:MAG: aminotransferase class IV [Parvularculaceae bacterium]